MKIEKNEKLVDNIHDKTEYAIHIINLKQVLNHGLVLEKIHRAIKFNEKAWRRPYVNMDAQSSKNQKMTLILTFSSWWIFPFL